MPGAIWDLGSCLSNTFKIVVSHVIATMLVV